MSFELVAGFDNGLPEAFHEKWVAAFAGIGFDIEFPPGVDIAQWQQCLIQIRVRKAPVEFIGFELPCDAVARIEISFKKTSAHFRTAAGQNTVDIAIQCFGVALIALLTGGIYANCHSGDIFSGDEALKEAGREAREYVAWMRKKNMEREYVLFAGWD